MNNEIKEILAYFEEYIKIKDMHDSEPMLNWKDLKIVLDYITNLQQAVKDTKDSADDMLYELKQENERLNSMLNNADNKNLSLIEEINDKQDIIDKAIELLQKYGNGTFDEDLLNILQNGSDDNE